MTLAGNWVYLLDAARVLALDRGFAYVASENVAVTSAGPGLGGAGTGTRSWSMMTEVSISTGGSSRVYPTTPVETATSVPFPGV